MSAARFRSAADALLFAELKGLPTTPEYMTVRAVGGGWYGLYRLR